MSISRRHFFVRAAAYAAGFAGLRSALSPARAGAWLVRGDIGFGDLVPDPIGLLDLPPGFVYQIISPMGREMDDGLIVPGRHDGMSAFPGPDGLTILVRNHEIEHAHNTIGPYGPANELLPRVPKVYDRGQGLRPSRGGCTTLVYDTRADGGRGRLVKHFLSLAGTERNCAGGPTPRNTWISCEESTVKRGDPSGLYEQDHGYCFEVPATTQAGLTDPQPIRAMGRFYREACATDPATGIVYQSEDLGDGLLYRYVPVNRDRLLDGGRVQALRVVGRPKFDGRNWERPHEFPIGQRVPVEWVDLEDVESPGDTLRFQGLDKGAARFARAEGMWYGAMRPGEGGEGAVYFCCTDGGYARRGQIWKYTPSPAAGTDHPAAGTDHPAEGAAHEREHPGVLELFIEPDNPSVIDGPDNICVAPWGDLVVCEDGEVDQHLFGVTPAGEVYKLARNAVSASELAGSTFSPDGTTLFVNMQNAGLTFAIRRAAGGPWRS